MGSADGSYADDEAGGSPARRVVTGGAVSDRRQGRGGAVSDADETEGQWQDGHEAGRADERGRADDGGDSEEVDGGMDGDDRSHVTGTTARDGRRSEASNNPIK